MIVTHDKTGKVYIVLDDTVKDCTNGQEDKVMVYYRNLEGKTFVREFEEFFNKFTLRDVSDIKYVERK